MKKLISALLLAAFWAGSLAAAGDECLSGDCVNGFGRQKTPTGDIYEGGFQNGLRHGFAQVSEMDGTRTEGFWENGELTDGMVVFPDGGRYVGQWRYRERNGEGILVEPDGTRYIGEFKSGRRHGWGLLVFADGRTYAGQFDMGKRSGWGTMVFPDGRRYVGQFVDGARTGEGTLTMPDGRVISGRFVDDELRPDSAQP